MTKTPVIDEKWDNGLDNTPWTTPALHFIHYTPGSRDNIMGTHPAFRI